MNAKRLLTILALVAIPVVPMLTGCGEYGSRADRFQGQAIVQSNEERADQEPPSPGAISDSAVAAFSDNDEPIVENPFLSVANSPRSTFAIDVDAASYSNTRGYVERGQLPPPSVVRIEELINYFSYSYPEPTDGHPFAFSTEVSDCPWDPEHRLVRVALQGKRLSADQTPPSNLVFLVDVSGSMEDRAKLPLLKESLNVLVDRLRPQDRVALVAYSGQAGLVLPSTPGSEKGKIRGAIDALEAGGSTAGGAGITLAYKIAEKYVTPGTNSRVILATDGDFNVGIQSKEELVSYIEEKRDKGVFLSVIGFGAGNYRDIRMEQLADHGNGNYYYIDSRREGERVLSTHLAGTLYTIAKDVKLQIAFNPDKVKAYRLIGYENRMMAAEDFDNDGKDAGDLGAGHSVTAFYEVVPVGAETGHPVAQISSDGMSMADEAPYRFASNDLMVARFRYKEPNGTTSKLIESLIADNHRAIAEAGEDFRFAAAVAEWGLLLRGSQYKGSAGYGNVLTLAAKSIGSDPDGYRSEFVDLVRRSADLSREDVADR